MGSAGLLSETLKKTVKHSLVYGIGMSFTAVSGIILVPLYTRFLSPGDYGVYALISIIFSLLFFLYDFGMVNAIFRWYYQYGSHQQESRSRVINTALLFLLGLATVFTILLWNNAGLLSQIIFNSRDFSHLIRLMLIGLFLQSLTWVPMSLLRIKEKVLTFTSVVVLGMILMVSGNFIFLSMGRGLNGVYEAYIITYLCMAIALFAMTWKHYAVDFSFGELSGMLKFGLPYIPVLFFSWVIDFSDRYLLAHLSSLQQVGLYSVGYRIGQAMYLVIKTFVVAWVPLMLSLHQKHGDNARSIFGRMFTYFLLLLIFLFVFVSIFSKDIIQVFTTSAYKDAASVIPWISFSYVLNGVYLFMLSGLIVAKNVYAQPIILLVSAVLNIVLNVVFIPNLGMIGSAVATLISYSLVAAATYYFAQKFYPIPIEWKRIAKIAVAAAATFYVGILVPKEALWVSILSKGMLIAVFFYILYIVGFFQQKEIDKLRFMFFKN